MLCENPVHKPQGTYLSALKDIFNRKVNSLQENFMN